MKSEIAKAQKIPYPEQIKVAEIYNIVARVLCETCKKFVKNYSMTYILPIFEAAL